MCGIAGFFHSARGREALRSELEPMVESIVHRGPDSSGHFCEDGIALGMRRLRIIDLEGGEQPMFDAHRNIVLTFNGEIYNHDELRRDLGQRGHQFKTRSDTEVLVYMYREYGSMNMTANVLLMMLAGALVNGPYALITTAVSADLGTHESLKGNARALATVTAIIDGTGSIGAAVGPFLVGYISAHSNDWNHVFFMLYAADLIAGLLLMKLVIKEIRQKPMS